ncbi:MAG: hypothetical protein RL021_1222 [Bacteroidota bacterium]
MGRIFVYYTDRMRRIIYLLAAAALFSCKPLAPNRMFKTSEHFPSASDSLNSVGSYVLAPFDHLTLSIFSNDGFKLIDIANQGYMDLRNSYVEYVLNEKGSVKLPVIGYVDLKGLTIEAAERLLESKYDRYFNQSYVHLEVMNRQAIVFIGDGKGQVVPLKHENTTLFEVLALAGGITDLGKAYRIQIIRGEGPNPKIYQADVSEMSGVAAGKVYIQSNDIIHVDAYPNYLSRFNQRLLPFFGILTTFLLVLNLTK